MSKVRLLKFRWVNILGLFFLLVLLASYTEIFAIASPYEPGATLDPECAPGETNCTVNILSGGGAGPWTESGSDISFINGKVGIGTGTPITELTIKGSSIVGEEKVINGAFDTDTTGWNVGSGVWNNGKVTITRGTNNYYSSITSSTNISVESGKSYVVSYEISDQYADIGGGVSVSISGISTETYYNNTNGHHVFYVKSDYTGLVNIKFSKYVDLNSPTWSLDNVSIKEISANSPIKILDSNNDQVFSLGDNSTYDFFVGLGAGYGVPNLNSTFMGKDAGYQATSAVWSNFFGEKAGYQATGAEFSNFFGEKAGYQAEWSGEANFIGNEAGYGVIYGWGSNFIGAYSGSGATEAERSNFIGFEAGLGAINASYSQFIGDSAGDGATDASGSEFIGSSSGQDAINAKYSQFIGNSAGYSSPNAANSIFIGKSSGYQDSVDNTAAYNGYSTFANTSILIGHNTNTGGFSNSIAIGAYAVNTATNQFMIGSTTRPIDTTRWNGSSSTQCTLTTGTGIACTSDENLKTNINDLESTTLEKLLNVRTVTFNWKEGNSDKLNIGFLAQDLEKYFPELVATDKDGLKSVYYANMTPILTEAIRELNLKVEELNISNSTEPGFMSTFFDTVIKSVSSGIAYMKDIVVDSLKVGSPEKRTGITLYDELTGEPYCFSIYGGESKTVEGECGIIVEQKNEEDNDSEITEPINITEEENAELIIEEVVDEDDDVVTEEIQEEPIVITQEPEEDINAVETLSQEEDIAPDVPEEAPEAITP